MSEDRNALMPPASLPDVSPDLYSPLFPNQTAPATSLGPTRVGTTSARNIANFNYGNIKTTEGGWESYSSPQEGVDAISNLIGRYQSRHDLHTVADIIERYAPQSDPGNRGKPLIAEAATRSGLDPGTRYDFSPGSPANRALTRAIIIQEQGSSSPAARTALSLAGGVQYAQAGPTPLITDASYGLTSQPIAPFAGVPPIIAGAPSFGGVPPVAAGSLPAPMQQQAAMQSTIGPSDQVAQGPTQTTPGQSPQSILPQALTSGQMMALLFSMSAQRVQARPISYDPWSIERAAIEGTNTRFPMSAMQMSPVGGLGLSPYTTRVGRTVPGPA